MIEPNSRSQKPAGVPRHLIVAVLLTAAALALWATEGAGQTGPASKPPVIIVVHGVYNVQNEKGLVVQPPRQPGWSNQYATAWGVPFDPQTGDAKTGNAQVKEVIFEDAYMPYSPEWAKKVQSDLIKIMKQAKQEGRPVMIVSHSWGNVMTKIALEGGEIDTRFDEGYKDKNGVMHTNNPKHLAVTLPAMPKDLVVDQWIGIGSPLGESEVWNWTTPDKQKGHGVKEITYTLKKPAQVRHWTNIFDWNDPISTAGRHVALAEGWRTGCEHRCEWAAAREHYWDEL